MFTTITAILGAITGSGSLLFNIKQSLPNLKIMVSKDHDSFITKSKYTSLTYDDKAVLAIISLKLTNRSKQPITVETIKFQRKWKGKKTWYNVDKHFGVATLSKDTGNGSSVYHNFILPPKELNLPLRIGSYDTKFIRIAAYYWNNNEIKKCGDNYKVRLRINTSNKVFKKTFFLPEIHKVVPDLDTYKQP